MLKKYAITTLESAKIVTPEMALGSEGNMEHFKKLAAEIKRVAPRSDEFIYFVCRAIHAMEASNYDPVARIFSGDGHIAKRGSDGKCEVCGDTTKDWQNGLWHSQKGTMPYFNQNGDAFPEAELLKDIEILAADGNKKKIKAFESFIGRGLFVNHASDDAEKIRGIILDAQWDSSTKGVDILVACDKIAYPELARQIQMGYSNDVSMGTQVQYSLCSECGNRAVTESDYCTHVKGGKGLARAGTRPVYEINNGLNFIEISVVSNGADPKAKIKTVLAALNQQIQERESRLNSCINPVEAEKLRDELHKIQAQVQDLIEKPCSCSRNESCQCDKPEEKTDIKEDKNIDLQKRREARFNIARTLGLSPEGDGNIALYKDNVSFKGGLKMSNKKAYFQGGDGLNDPSALPYDKEDYAKVRDTMDKQMIGQGMEPGNDGLAGDDLSVKEQLHRASLEKRREIRKALLQKAYFQGGEGLNDPATLPYDKEDYAKVRDTMDKQMVGQGMEPGNDGLAGDDLSVKEQLHRAKLRARFVAGEKKVQSSWTLFSGDQPILTASAGDLYPGDLEKPNADNPEITNWDWVASKDYGKNLIRAVKELGFDEVKAQIEKAKVLAKKAQALPELPPAPPASLPEGEPTLEGPLPEEPKGDGKELSPKEQIAEALSAIEDAVREIRALSDGDNGSVDMLETEIDLEEAGKELGDLGVKLDAAKGEKAQKRMAVVTKEAIRDSRLLLKKARSFFGSRSPAAPKIDKIACEESLKEAEKDLGQAMSAAKKGDPKKVKEEIEEAKHEVKEIKEEMKEDKKEASLQNRKLARVKLAKELAKMYGLTDSDMVGEAHPQGGTDTMCGEGEKLEGDAHVETIKEQQEADLEVAEKQPRGELVAKDKKPVVVADKKEDKKEKEEKKEEKEEKKKEKEEEKKEEKEEEKEEKCEECEKDPCECKKEEKKEEKKEKKDASERRRLRHEAIKGLSSNAEVDNEAKTYYKELFNESSTGNPSDPAAKQFGKEMTDEFVGKKSTAENHELKTRMKRAYKVALRQQDLGQIEKTAEALESQVERLVNMDTAGFEAFEDVIDHTNIVKDAKVDKPIVKSAGAVRVGQMQPGSDNLTDQLGKINWS